MKTQNPSFSLVSYPIFTDWRAGVTSAGEHIASGLPRPTCLDTLDNGIIRLWLYNGWITLHQEGLKLSNRDKASSSIYFIYTYIKRHPQTSWPGPEELLSLQGLFVQSSNWFAISSVQFSSLGTSLSGKLVQSSSGHQGQVPLFSSFS